MLKKIIALFVPVIVLVIASSSAADQKAVAAIEEAGGSVLKVAANTDELEVDFHLGGKNVDAALAHVSGAGKVVRLHLGGTDVTDAGLKHVAGLKDLERLHLERTKITDAGLAQLKGLENLSYLNLYGTPVTDEGVKSLAGLKNLKKVFLWQSKVTEEGAKALSKALPKTMVNLGLEAKVVEAVVPPSAGPAAKTDPKNLNRSKPNKTLAKGRYVRVRLSGSGRILSLAEVEVIETKTGRALQKEGTASQSSIFAGGSPQRAADGNTNGLYQANSVTHTNTQANPFWLLDLKSDRDIGRIRVWNRKDCCGVRLEGAVVEVLAADKKKVLFTATVKNPVDGSFHEFEKK